MLNLTNYLFLFLIIITNTNKKPFGVMKLIKNVVKCWGNRVKK